MCLFFITVVTAAWSSTSHWHPKPKKCSTLHETWKPCQPNGYEHKLHYHTKEQKEAAELAMSKEEYEKMLNMKELEARIRFNEQLRKQEGVIHDDFESKALREQAILEKEFNKSIAEEEKKRMMMVNEKIAQQMAEERKKHEQKLQKKQYEARAEFERKLAEKYEEEHKKFSDKISNFDNEKAAAFNKWLSEKEARKRTKFNAGIQSEDAKLRERFEKWIKELEIKGRKKFYSAADKEAFYKRLAFDVKMSDEQIVEKNVFEKELTEEEKKIRLNYNKWLKEEKKKCQIRNNILPSDNDESENSEISEDSNGSMSQEVPSFLLPPNHPKCNTKRRCPFMANQQNMTQEEMLEAYNSLAINENESETEASQTFESWMEAKKASKCYGPRPPRNC
ncbi:hypothetical protein BDAP_000587 [Binucleata daphniae]